MLVVLDAARRSNYPLQVRLAGGNKSHGSIRLEERLRAKIKVTLLRRIGRTSCSVRMISSRPSGTALRSGRRLSVATATWGSWSRSHPRCLRIRTTARWSADETNHEFAAGEIDDDVLEFAAAVDERGELGASDEVRQGRESGREFCFIKAAFTQVNTLAVRAEDSQGGGSVMLPPTTSFALLRNPDCGR